MNTKHGIATLVALVAGVVAVNAQTWDGSEWLVNPGAENTATGSIGAAQLGWAIFGNNNASTTIDVVNYASIPDFADPLTPGPDPSIRGNNFFMAGKPAAGNTNTWWVSTMRQLFAFYGNVPACEIIDKGDVPFTLSGWLGGLMHGQTWVKLIGKFTLENGSVAYDKVVGDVNDGTRGSKTGLFYREWTGIIPSKTRKIEIFVEMGKFGNWDAGPDLVNLAAADNLSLKVGVVPEPASMVALSLGALGLIARRRRQR